jgi:hypothetical protein
MKQWVVREELFVTLFTPLAAESARQRRHKVGRRP